MTNTRGLARMRAALPQREKNQEGRTTVHQHEQKMGILGKERVQQGQGYWTVYSIAESWTGHGIARPNWAREIPKECDLVSST